MVHVYKVKTNLKYINFNNITRLHKGNRRYIHACQTLQTLAYCMTKPIYPGQNIIKLRFETCLYSQFYNLQTRFVFTSKSHSSHFWTSTGVTMNDTDVEFFSFCNTGMSTIDVTNTPSSLHCLISKVCIVYSPQPFNASACRLSDRMLDFPEFESFISMKLDLLIIAGTL